LAAGDLWPCDLGLDLSRTFRALKTWMTIETLGTAKIGAAILHNCGLARYLAAKIEKSPIFELKAPVTLNIVCFGVRGADASSINRELVLDVQESGVAAPSWTTINGETVIRCAIVNHRTVESDIDAFVNTITRLAKSRKVKQA
jgi:glutamate/tyrosine decarboxylase-like PLP-dependent enzyme